MAACTGRERSRSRSRSRRERSRAFFSGSGSGTGSFDEAPRIVFTSWIWKDVSLAAGFAACLPAFPANGTEVLSEEKVILSSAVKGQIYVVEIGKPCLPQTERETSWEVMVSELNDQGRDRALAASRKMGLRLCGLTSCRALGLS